MEHTTEFSVRYLTDDPVPIRDIIESLYGVEAILQEMAAFLPMVVEGVQVQRLTIKVKEVAQESPLRELFLVGLFLAFQDDLEREVPNAITEFTGIPIADRFDTIVTVLALVIIFYGAGALKDLVFGKGPAGQAEFQLNSLIEELSLQTGTPKKQIREKLDERYLEAPKWKRVANAASRFFLPSKRQDSAPFEVNSRRFDQDVVRDVPADYIVQHEADTLPSRNFENALVELHAQDKDHSGSGWAAVVDHVSEKRLKLKLMEGVASSELWGADRIRGDITVIYERIGSDLRPKEIHLHRVLRMS